MISNRRILTRFAAFALAASAGTAANAQLLNAGFETAGSGGPVFANWGDFGNGGFNISRASEAVRNGAFSCKLFGQFLGDFNATGIFQDLPTTRDRVWNAEAFFQHITGDQLQGGNFAAMNIEFRASNGDLLEYWGLDTLTAASPRDVFIQQMTSGVAPDDAVTARLTLLFLQPDIDGGAVHIDDASLSSSGTDSTLINPSFEDFGGFGAAQNARGWGQFPRFASNIFRNSAVPRTGGFAGFMFGQFIGVENFNGFYQTFDVTAGQRVDAEVFALHLAANRLAEGNFGFINLEFLNAANQLVAAIDKIEGMRAILCLFEGVATGAADGHARVTGHPAMTLLHLGAGVTIRADARSSHQSVVTAMDVAARQGFTQVNIATVSQPAED